MISKSKYVSDVMSSKVLAVKNNETLAEVFRLMDENNFRHVPVVDEDKNIVGILSDRDILKHFVDEDLKIASLSQGEYLSDHPVSELMTSDPITVNCDTLLSEACQLLLESKFNCLPVVDNQYLIGILTTSDVLRAMMSAGDES